MTDHIEERNQFFRDVLVALAGVVVTPEKGYEQDGGFSQVLADIKTLRRDWQIRVDGETAIQMALRDKLQDADAKAAEATRRIDAAKAFRRVISDIAKARKAANTELGKQIARLTENLEGQKRIRVAEGRMVQGVWKSHEAQFAEQLAALTAAQARIEELERERAGLAERIRREKKTVESTDALVKQAAIAALEHAAALVEQAGENSNVKGTKE